MIPYAQWQAERLAALTAPDGWLNLTDRLDLGQGSQSLGSASDNDLILSRGPAHLGQLTVLSPDSATLIRDGETYPFLPHPGANPRLILSDLLMEIHTVEGISALRVRDLTLRRHVDLHYFPYDPSWIIPAKWQALATARRAGIEMIGGKSEVVLITHQARFSHQGHEVTLLPTHSRSGFPMFVIRDATSGHETYGASRFLVAEPQGDQIFLDFNRAHNPPCAFTDFAICPLPPPENRLPFAIRAGEFAP